MEERNEHIDDLIVGYLTENLEEDALLELKQWRTASPENERYFCSWLEVWHSAVDGSERFRYDKTKAFDVFRNRVAATRQPATPRIGFRRRNWIRYAVALVLLCAISCLSYWRGGETVKGNFAEIVVEAPLGSRTKSYLPDGTLVWLNSGSRMTYSQGFGVEERRVSLAGEGYFEVTPDKHLPFQVQTQSLRVKVLGTKFNFRDYPEDELAVVSLLEGKVALDNLLRNDRGLTLAPDERVVLNKRSGKMQLEQTNPSGSKEWADGNLFFDEALLPDIVKELERSYNVRIVLADSGLNEVRFYGHFVRDRQTIGDVLEALSATGKMVYRMEEDQIVLYQNRDE